MLRADFDERQAANGRKARILMATRERSSVALCLVLAASSMTNRQLRATSAGSAAER